MWVPSKIYAIVFGRTKTDKMFYKIYTLQSASHTILEIFSIFCLLVWSCPKGRHISDGGVGTVEFCRTLATVCCYLVLKGFWFQH
jgi:hypothetical protein